MRSVAAERAPRAVQRPALYERRGAVRWWSLLVVILLLSGVAVWLVSPRFAIDTPSLEDDWAAIARSPDQLSEVARFTNPEDQRFRPGWIVWNYVQWHTFDAPRGLVGPNAWNIARLLVFVVGLCLLTALALPPPRGPWEAALYPVLAGIPALLVLTVPKLTRDVARFGTQEPLLLGGMALGGSLLLLAARSLLTEVRPLAWWRAAVLGIAGTVLWLVGVYQKEASVCAIPLLAAALFVGRHRLSAWRGLGTRPRVALGALGAIVLLPLAHVAIEIVRIAARGDLVYEAEVDRGRGIWNGVQVLYDWAHEVFSPDAQLVVWGAVGLTILAVLIRRRVDFLAAGALASGVLTFLFAGQSGVAVSRYYMPLYALFAVALALSLARLPRIFQLAGLAWIFLTFMPPPGVREEVSGWTHEEQDKATLVRAVTDLESSGCVVAVGGLDAETSEALPVLVGLDRRPTAQTCAQDDTYLVVRLSGDGIPLVRACARGALRLLMERFFGSIYRCGRLQDKPVRDATLGLVEPERLVALRRLRPVLES
jgi:hypothetical protein